MGLDGQFGVTLFWCLAGGLIIVPETWLHPIIGKIVLVPACLFVFLLGGVTEYSTIGAIFTILVLVVVHGAAAEARAEKLAAKQAASEPAAERPSAPAKPAAEPAPPCGGPAVPGVRRVRVDAQPLRVLRTAARVRSGPPRRSFLAERGENGDGEE
ncbi:MAG TPA: hypothetical protein VHG93_07730 [Longimicrobium sp.]|nr:hypothetical protein [Longimicrobium sp.]